MRATKHRTKRRACGLCKPQKKGWEPKDTPRQKDQERAAIEEIREAEGYPRAAEAMVRAIATDCTPFYQE